MINFSFWIPFLQRFPGLTPPLVCFPRCAYLRFLTLFTSILFSKSQLAWGVRLFLYPQGYATSYKYDVNRGLIFDLLLPCCDMLGKYTTCFSIIALMFSSVKWKGKTRSLYCSIGLSLEYRGSYDKTEGAPGWLAEPHHMDVLCSDVLYIGLIPPWWGLLFFGERGRHYM